MGIFRRRVLSASAGVLLDDLDRTVQWQG